MSGNLELWTEPFELDSAPAWPCPECAEGSLALIRDSLVSKATARCEAAMDLHGPEDVYYEGHFSCRMKCANSRCGQTVFVTGTSKYVEDLDAPSGGIFDLPATRQVFVPVFALPAPPLLRLPDSWPKDLRDKLRVVFQLFLPDPSAAGAKLRRSVETLMDIQGIAKTRVTKAGKRVRVDLHDRILALKAKHAKAGDLLLAAKWLGNEATHGELSHREVFDGVELVAGALNDLYDRGGEQLQRRARQIIRRKGPIRRRAKGGGGS